MKIILLVLCISLKAFAGDYITGEEACHLDNVKQEPYGQYIDVPIDYKNPNGEKAKIYFWSLKKFNSNLKTLVYISGGPGAHDHTNYKDGYTLTSENTSDISEVFPDWNVIAFDQRGVYCSRAANKTLAMDANFYSSENTARDIDEIRKYLGVQKWTVFGSSYGTVPGTIYGHLFSKYTRSLILEATLFNSDVSQWNSDWFLERLNGFYKSLPPKVKLKVAELSSNPEIAPTWFGNLFYKSVYGVSTEDYQDFLNHRIWNEKDYPPIFRWYSLRKLVERWKSAENNMEDSSYMYFVIMCSELVTSFTELEKYDAGLDKFVYDDNFSFRKIYCDNLNIPQKKLYSALDYTLDVPVYYFQGAFDNRTPYPLALKHFQKVPQGSAQMIVNNNAGHAVVEALDTHTYLSKPFSKVFLKAMNAEIITEEDIQELNKYPQDSYKLLTK
jgi:proline iminopeptidase